MMSFKQYTGDRTDNRKKYYKKNIVKLFENNKKINSNVL